MFYLCWVYLETRSELSTLNAAPVCAVQVSSKIALCPLGRGGGGENGFARRWGFYMTVYIRLPDLCFSNF